VLEGKVFPPEFVPPPGEEIEAFLAEHGVAVPRGKIRAFKSMESAMKAIFRQIERED
jgi:hypothetical protein